MPDQPPFDLSKLRIADPAGLKDSLASALKFEGRKRVHDSDAFMANIVADRLVRHLDRSGFVVMMKPPVDGHSNIARGPLDKE